MTAIYCQLTKLNTQTFNYLFKGWQLKQWPIAFAVAFPACRCFKYLSQFIRVYHGTWKNFHGVYKYYIIPWPKVSLFWYFMCTFLVFNNFSCQRYDAIYFITFITVLHLFQSNLKIPLKNIEFLELLISVCRGWQAHVLFIVTW